MKQSYPLNKLLSSWFHIPHDTAIETMTLDSREVSSGALFIAIKGHQVDGRQFINRAITEGAVAVLSDANDASQHGDINYIGEIPIISVFHLSSLLSDIANKFYDHPSTKMSVIGVTGTNGKTTITQLIAQWRDLIDGQAGVMGTTGNGFLSDMKTAANTTGNAIEVQQQLALMEQQNATLVAMEISSHGLIQQRVSAVNFTAALFTNLSRDHLDYHGDMESYEEAKKLLFTTHQPNISILNCDDPVARGWINQISPAVSVATSRDNIDLEQQYLYATEIKYSQQGVMISFSSSWGDGSFSAPLVGKFNVSNLLLALATLLSLGFSLSTLIATASQLKAVIGRMELFQQTDKPLAVVDYAHTPDALEKALMALRVHCKGKLWAIVGCGGDRDRGKRSLMAAAAVGLSDYTIFTNDNPRNEDPSQIIDDMMAGVESKDQIVIEQDREQACHYALSRADVDDIILIAGKGHEDYQILADKTIHYSDRETVSRWLGITL
ncbi:UDP-N-acetylmuramoyl-L-alanyl-D-glutamate--2,6-diaminopimelate ligase [Vibrio sp. SS-MA-C1-2]|uniref:UDP-N-acetylmuramoyl-L-alanyl-D-glutamate--2, 6-diaminopimelate ligase n=1 Tax=Vibrio sp. SS-MA-C1-2 TaxID=2908646 RepID=UPI001F30E796|nr:UDP-N-acetylmuramoyl-L-alanyl-D-glutamate--2,6-diaminopimelate ligase [Vibrio sp. SS-MA-C1-2]UJF19605.1 UDP-N-acetylmuramoyl-L-alanyl-D-glutamate--2,6-diaminopimelate ligase [Vibrio sp. SS-MA-C1-2]